MAKLVQVWTEDLPEQRVMEAILRERLDRREISIETGAGGTSILSITSSRLIRDPQQPMALVLDAEGEEPTELHRLIYRYMPAVDTWVDAVAVPDVDAWAWADPRLAEVFRSTPGLAGDRYRRAEAIGRLTGEIPFDVAALRETDEEFRRLEEFLDRHAGRGRRAKPARARRS